MVFILNNQRSLQIRPIHPSYSLYCFFFCLLRLVHSTFAFGGSARCHNSSSSNTLQKRQQLAAVLLQVPTNRICFLSRQVEVWLCRFWYSLFLARNRPSKLAIAASSPTATTTINTVICVSDLGLSGGITRLGVYCCTRGVCLLQCCSAAVLQCAAYFSN